MGSGRTACLGGAGLYVGKLAKQMWVPGTVEGCMAAIVNKSAVDAPLLQVLSQ